MQGVPRTLHYAKRKRKIPENDVGKMMYNIQLQLCWYTCLHAVFFQPVQDVLGHGWRRARQNGGLRTDQRDELARHGCSDLCSRLHPCWPRAYHQHAARILQRCIALLQNTVHGLLLHEI